MVERELEKLKCYACNGEVCQIGSGKFKAWATEYKTDFGKSYISSGDAPLNVGQHYFDPDGSYKKGTDHSFFNDLETFLNRREKEMSNHLQRSFEYKFVEGEGIEVSGTVREGEKIQPFYLRSDQFGFSAPTNNKAHPYDLYIKNHEDKDTAIDQVIKWIAMSRTIGGSFLWPKDIWGGKGGRIGYNLARGGSINKSSYIEDRVDLTLCEIKHYLDKKDYENDILYKYIDDNSMGKKWIESFGDFPRYVEYFCFNPFVDENNMPYDIVESDFAADDKKPIREDKESKSIFNMNINELERMFNNVYSMIKERSNMI